MPQHTVEQGQTIAHIAYEHGVSMQSILLAAENQDLLSRRSMNVLFEGDVVFVPDEPPKQIGIETGRSHLFFYQPRSLPVRVQFLRGGAPRARYTVEWSVDGGAATQTQLDEQGWLRVEVPMTGKQLKVVFYPGSDHAEERTFELGHLDPHDEVRGVQQRLNNLGFTCGAEDGDAADKTRAALETYKRAHGLGESSELDDTTLAHLAGRHRI